MNIVPKLLFLSLVIINTIHSNDDKNLKSEIKEHNKKRIACSNNHTRTISQQVELQQTVKEEAEKLINPLIEELHHLRENIFSTEIDQLRKTQQEIKRWEKFEALSQSASKCHNENQCDEFYALEKELLSSKSGQYLQYLNNLCLYTILKHNALIRAYSNARDIIKFNNIEEALTHSINSPDFPRNSLRDNYYENYNYFDYIQLGYTAPVFNQVKKEMMDFINKTFYEEDSQ